jgi:hypothetical protein
MTFAVFGEVGEGRCVVGRWGAVFDRGGAACVGNVGRHGGLSGNEVNAGSHYHC